MEILKNTSAFLIFLSAIATSSFAQNLKGDLIYSNTLSSENELKGWTMEGSGQTEYKDGWLCMFSPEEKSHHVYWCPEEFPESFIAEWEVRNLHPEAGLCIVFFSAEGLNGEDILSARLKQRNGNFKHYTKGDINNYHISYYANTPTQKGRPFAHLRKNIGFHKVQTGEAGIPHNSEGIHTVRLVKDSGHIQLFIDDRPVIDWQDDGKKFGTVLGTGKIGFRQMKWTRFEYRNFNLYQLAQ